MPIGERGARALSVLGGRGGDSARAMRRGAGRRRVRQRDNSTAGVHLMTARSGSHALGFTIIEQAVSLSVVALVLGSIMVPLQTQVENRKVDQTRRTIELAQEMLLGYAAANGYFPCPADAASNGQEAAGSDHAAGACTTYQGFLPAALLGFKPTDTNGYAIDAWESHANRVRYAISDRTVAGVPNVFTRANGMRSVPLASLGSSTHYFICQSGAGAAASDCGTSVTLASNAVVVVWSTGPNAATGGTSVHEAQNPNARGGSADRVFVSRMASDAPGHEFDDIVGWVPMTALLSRLVAAGQFTPAAQTAVSPPAAVASAK
jgi:type II secretory pathway pseudopilin PulG